MKENVDLSNGIVMPNFSNYVVFPEEGKIWSKQRKSSRGKWVGAPRGKYLICCLRNDDGKDWKVQFHRVIWTAVNGAIPEGYDIHHKDSNPLNNSISNLEMIDTFSHLSMHHKGKKIPKEQVEKHREKMINRKDLSYPLYEYDDNLNLIKTYPSIRQCARDNNYPKTTLQYKINSGELYMGKFYTTECVA